MKTLKRCSIQLVALLGLLFLAACAASLPTMATDVVLAPTSTSTSVPLTNTLQPTATSTPRSQGPTSTRFPTATPPPTLPVPTAIPHRTVDIVEGYWIQNTTQDGLCSDSPRVLRPDPAGDNLYFGDDHSTICYFGSRPLEYWPYEYGSGGPGGFSNWHTEKIPQIGRITGAADLHASKPEWAVYGIPSFVGVQGKCVLESEGDYPDVKGRWHCFTEAEGLPFSDIRGYGVAGSVYKSTIEWFMSEDSIASLGLSPKDQTYSIPELIGVAGARPTWLSVSFFPEDGVWVGTNGYGVINIDPEKETVTRYTTAEGLPNNTIRYIEPCGKHCVWVGTSNGLGQWDGSNWRQYTTHDGLPDSDIFDIGNDWGGDWAGTWIATAGGPAFLKWNADYWQSFPNFPPSVKITGVAGNIFTTQGKGLFKFQRGPIVRGSTALSTNRDGLPSNQITTLAATEKGILVGTSRGAAEWDGEHWMQITNESVNDASSTLIAADSGLWAWDSSAWTKAANDRVALVAEEGWYATTRKVCRFVDGESNCPTTSDGQSLSDAKTLYVDPVSHEVFVLDGNNNPWKYDAATQRFVAGTDDKWFPDYLPKIVRDMVAQPSEWQYATDEGVYFVPFNSDEGFNGVTNPDYSLTEGWPISVRRMSLDTATGTTWLATNQGAFHSDKERGWVYVAGLSSRNITAVLATSDAIWFGTADVGLIRFVPAKP